MKFLLPISKSIYNMVKYISIILLTLLSSCIITGKWNEMGRKRFSLSRFSLHANKGEEEKIKNRGCTDPKHVFYKNPSVW